MTNTEFTPRTADENEKCRNAFVERANRPTYSELSEEFNIPLSTIGKWSAQDGWIAMRSVYWERKTLEGDALSLIHEAATRVNRPVIAAITNAVLLAVQNIAETFQAIDPDKQKSPALELA